MYPDLTQDEVFMIGTRRLWLRWPRRHDADQLAAIGGHPDVATMTATWPVGCDAAYARDRIASMRARNTTGAALSLVIAERGQWHRAIGLVGLALSSNDTATATLGYHLDPGVWGRGYASEAIDGIVAMTSLLTRIVTVRAGVMPHNTASRRALAKSGFNPTGKSVFHSPLKGPIEVIDMTRALRPRSKRPRNLAGPDHGFTRAVA